MAADLSHPPHRGSIIVDTSALISLCAPASEHARNQYGKPAHYIDLLLMLANNGYQIIIPEMVSLEAAEMPRTGQRISNLFPNSTRYKSDDILPTIIRDAILPSNNPHKEYKGLMLASDTGPREVDNFCNKILWALSLSDNDEKRRRISEITKQPKSQYGDRAIISLMRGAVSTFPDDNIIVLSDDTRLIKSITSEFGKGRSLTTTKLLAAMCQTGLARNAGIHPEISDEMLLIDYFSHSERKQTEHDSLEHVLRMPKPASSKFYASLMQLAADMETAQPDQPEAVASDPGPSGHVAKFKARYAKFTRAGVREC